MITYIRIEKVPIEFIMSKNTYSTNASAFDNKDAKIKTNHSRNIFIKLVNKNAIKFKPILPFPLQKAQPIGPSLENVTKPSRPSPWIFNPIASMVFCHIYICFQVSAFIYFIKLQQNIFSFSLTFDVVYLDFYLVGQ